MCGKDPLRGGSDLSEQAKSYQKLAHEVDTQKNWRRKAQKMGFGDKTSQMAGQVRGDVLEDENHPQPEFSCAFSGDAYGKEAHTPTCLSFLAVPA